MSAKSKYIIFENSLGMELPVVFSPLIEHRDIKLNDSSFKPVSAGFCLLAQYEPYYDSVWGESVSLRLESRPDIDAKILNKYLQYDC